MFFRFLVITSFFPVVTADVHKKCSCYDNGCYFNGQLQLVEPIKRVVHHYDDFALLVVIGIAIEGKIHGFFVP